MTRTELQTFFDYADDQVERAVRLGRKGALAAYRDATVFKVMYGWGSRCTETSRLDTVDFHRNAAAPELGAPPAPPSPDGPLLHQLAGRRYRRGRHPLAPGAPARPRARYHRPRPHSRTAPAAVRATAVPDLRPHPGRRPRRRHHTATAPGHPSGGDPAAARHHDPRTGAPPGQQGPPTRTRPQPLAVPRFPYRPADGASQHVPQTQGPRHPAPAHPQRLAHGPRRRTSRDHLQPPARFSEQTAANWIAESGGEDATYGAHRARTAGGARPASHDGPVTPPRVP